jgi:hypothetical protein
MRAQDRVRISSLTKIRVNHGLLTSLCVQCMPGTVVVIFTWDLLPSSQQYGGNHRHLKHIVRSLTVPSACHDVLERDTCQHGLTVVLSIGYP